MIEVNTANGFLSLLDEDEPELYHYALEKLNEIVPEFWAEIAHSIDKIEVLYDDDEFEHRKLAALVASKVYYYLGEYSDAMTYALGAGELFDVRGRDEYVDTLISKCFDEYIKQRTLINDEGKIVEIDPRLENIIESMFERCFNEGGYKEALGIALETRRMDKIKQAIESASDKKAMLEYCMEVCLATVTLRDFRHNVFNLMIDIYDTLSSPDHLLVCRILVFLNDDVRTSKILHQLISSENEDDHLLAYQIAFDLVNNGTQQYLLKVRQSLPKVEEADDDDDAPEGPTSIKEEDDEIKGNDFNARNKKLQLILSGGLTIQLYLEFLHRNNHADLTILKNTKNVLDARQSVSHSALIFANAIMNAGTTRDSFLRDHLEWLSRATNWAKFSATAGLGVIHKGHLKQGLSLLGPYLPRQGTSSCYSEGGALFALGLIHANHGETILQYLRDALNNTEDNVIQHGTCLGLGVAGMATGNESIYNDLNRILISNDAVAAEAAGLAMGLVMLGTAKQDAIEHMLDYAHKTQHEKIIRGLAMGIAMIMYGREEQADDLIEQLMHDTDPILRYGGMFTIAMAYRGTANNNAIRHLLHMAVSDVSDDVRRAAVMCLGFLLSRQPEQCPRIVSLLAESYNPHVRYGATLAVGIACAGTAMPEAIDLLLPMASDSVDFVRQGALIALAMVLIQSTKAQELRVERVRKLFEEKLTTKGEQLMAKFGAILGQGIIDAAGRNVTISTHSLSGHPNMSATVGLALFTQYWYWYPLTHFLCLAFTPTTVIGLNKDLKMPKFEFTSSCRPSLFAYPAKVKPPTAFTPAKVKAAVLSTTRKANARAQQKEDSKQKADQDSMEVEPAAEKEEAKKEEKKEEVAEGEKAEAEAEAEPEKKKKEVKSEIKHNPCRITLPQLKYLSVNEGERYKPIRYTTKGDLFGITILKDTKPELPEEFVEIDGTSTTAASNAAAAKKDTKSDKKDAMEEDEAAPPAAFEFKE